MFCVVADFIGSEVLGKWFYDEILFIQVDRVSRGLQNGILFFFLFYWPKKFFPNLLYKVMIVYLYNTLSGGMRCIHCVHVKKFSIIICQIERVCMG